MMDRRWERWLANLVWVWWLAFAVVLIVAIETHA